MIIFQVKLNGETVTSAGKEDLAVLSAIVGATGALGSKSGGTKTEKIKSNFNLTVGGLSSTSENDNGTHLNWLRQDLSIGDKIEVTILDNGKAEMPVEKTPVDSGRAQEQEKEYWERAKKYYFEHKEKYE